MKITEEDIKKLKELEESLWRSGTRFDIKYMSSLLSSGNYDFIRELL